MPLGGFCPLDAKELVSLDKVVGVLLADNTLTPDLMYFPPLGLQGAQSSTHAQLQAL